MIDGKLLYPIGSIYMSIQDTNPSVFFGGTWERIKDKFLLSAGDTYSGGDSGGDASHRHDFRVGYTHAWGDMGADGVENQGAYSYSQNKYNKASGNASSFNVNMNGNRSDSLKSTQGTLRYSTGDTDLASTLPPYLVVYMWKRTA